MCKLKEGTCTGYLPSKSVCFIWISSTREQASNTLEVDLEIVPDNWLFFQLLPVYISTLRRNHVTSYHDTRCFDYFIHFRALKNNKFMLRIFRVTQVYWTLDFVCLYVKSNGLPRIQAPSFVVRTDDVSWILQCTQTCGF